MSPFVMVSNGSSALIKFLRTIEVIKWALIFNNTMVVRPKNCGMVICLPAMLT